MPTAPTAAVEPAVAGGAIELLERAVALQLARAKESVQLHSCLFLEELAAVGVLQLPDLADIAHEDRVVQVPEKRLGAEAPKEEEREQEEAEGPVLHEPERAADQEAGGAADLPHPVGAEEKQGGDLEHRVPRPELHVQRVLHPPPEGRVIHPTPQPPSHPTPPTPRRQVSLLPPVQRPGPAGSRGI